MAGGRGERFWPLSRAARPKQLIPMPGGRTLLADAVARLAPLFPPERILVITAADFADEVRRQAPGVEVVGEPVGRDTAAAIGLAATLLERRCPGSAFVSVHADHVIRHPDAYRAAVALALRRAATGALVTLGVPPRGPETTWGYIERGTERAPGVFAASAFHEKPGRARAEGYLATGRFYWNAGIFVWKSARLLEELRRHQPDLAAGLAHIGSVADLPAVYPGLPKISIDHAVMEKADRIEVVHADVGLFDVGTWEAFAAEFLGDPQGPGAVDASGCLVYSSSPDHLVALYGVSDLMVIQTPDATLVCPRSRAADLKVLLSELRRRGLERKL